MKRTFVAILSILLVSSLAILPVNSKSTPVNSQELISVHLTLGNPSGATDDESNRDNFLMVKPQYVLSFNNARGGPNWVSWHLQASDIGSQARAKTFSPDPSLPEGFTRVVTRDYNSTGFDRGHICNSKDRTNTRANNNATFLLTNILPQAPDNNQGPWVRLENFERELAQQGNELYIVAGAFGTGGTGRNGRKNSIADGEVNVPKTFWKVLVVLRRGNNDLSRVNNSTRTIAVCMPNKQGIRNIDWHRYITTIRNVEAATGYDFLSEVSSGVQNSIETRRDSSAVGSASSNPCQ